MSKPIRSSILEALGKRITDYKIPACGLTQAKRYALRLEGGSGVFVKAAVNVDTARWLRVEHRILTTLAEDFVPAIVAWLEPEDSHQILISEDLSYAHWPADHWPVQWNNGQIDRLLATLDRLALMTPPDGLPVLQATPSVWRQIVLAPEPFLRLGLCSSDWFAQALPTLIEAEEAVPLAGDSLVHDDVRSDNVCFIGERVVLVDWSQAMRGHADYDKAKVLPTLHLEGGPPPYQFMPDGGAWAAWGSAEIARRAIVEQAQIPDWLHKVFLRLTGIQLQWAAQCLNLPNPDGIDWREI